MTEPGMVAVHDGEGKAVGKVPVAEVHKEQQRLGRLILQPAELEALHKRLNETAPCSST